MDKPNRRKRKFRYIPKEARDQFLSLAHDVKKTAQGKQSGIELTGNTVKKTAKASLHILTALGKSILSSLRTTQTKKREEQAKKHPRKKFDKHNREAMRTGKKRHRKRNQKAFENTRQAHLEAQAKEQETRAYYENKPEPQPFRQADSGELIHRCKCTYVHCLGTGEFFVADGQMDWYLEKFDNPPAACYPCRYNAWKVLQDEFQTGPCEECGTEVVISSSVWQQRRKKKGLPTFAHFCQSCQSKRLATEQRLEIGNLESVEGMRKYVGKYKVSDDSVLNKKQLQIVKSRINIHGTYQRLDNVVPDTEIINFYSQKIIGKGTRQHTRLAHIEAHFTGQLRYLNGTTKPKDTGLSSLFANTEAAIAYAHNVARRGGYDNVYTKPLANPDGSLSNRVQYHDLNKGLFFVMEKATQTEAAHLVTMFLPGYDETVGPQLPSFEKKQERVDETLSYLANQDIKSRKK